MFDRILFPTDGNKRAASVLDHAIDLADAHDARLHVLHVADTMQDSVTQIQGEVLDTLVTEGERIVDDAAQSARDRGVDVVAEVLQGRPAETILEYADTRDVDLLVMPTHGRRGLSRLLLGSTTERVVRRSKIPVLTVRPDETAVSFPYRNVLVPTDGSEAADDALSLGVALAVSEDAALHLLSVIDVRSLGVDVRSDLQLDAFEERAEDVLEASVAVADDAGVESVTTTVEYGTSIHEAILAFVEEHDVDLVVLGTHGRTGLDRYLLGSVAESVLRTAPVPVLTVRESVDD